MIFSLWIRNNITDRALSPIREQIAGLVPYGARVVEIGCANGRLLFDLSAKIEQGLGVDLDKKTIAFAKSKAADYPDLQFIDADALTFVDKLLFTPTITIASLCLHEMTEEISLAVLRRYAEVSEKLIIADLYEPDAIFQKLMLHVDEWVAGHYGCFKSYLAGGEMPALINKAGIATVDELTTEIPGVRIWVCQKSQEIA